MSNNKNRNYTNYSRMSTSDNIDPVVETDVEEVVETPSVSIPEEEPPKSVEVPKTPSEKKYKIHNCDLLNVRVIPDGDILTIVNKDETLTDNGPSENPAWIKVKTESGIFGYVKKAFVSLI